MLRQKVQDLEKEVDTLNKINIELSNEKSELI